MVHHRTTCMKGTTNDRTFGLDWFLAYIESFLKTGIDITSSFLFRACAKKNSKFANGY